MVLIPVLAHATCRMCVKAVKVLPTWCSGHLLHFPLLMELPVPLETLRIAELLPTEAALVVLGAGVDCLMLAEVEGLSEVLPTDGAVVGLLPRVDAVVSAQGFAACEPSATDTAQIRPWNTTGPGGSGGVLSTLGGLSICAWFFLGSGLSRALWFDIGVLWITTLVMGHIPTHSSLIPPSSVVFIHPRSCRWREDRGRWGCC